MSSNVNLKTKNITVMLCDLEGLGFRENSIEIKWDNGKENGTVTTILCWGLFLDYAGIITVTLSV